MNSLYELDADIDDHKKIAYARFAFNIFKLFRQLVYTLFELIKLRKFESFVKLVNPLKVNLKVKHEGQFRCYMTDSMDV